MRIAIATVQVPFIHGGGELHAEGLLRALTAAGHEADVVSMPFRFSPADEVRRAMEAWENEDFEILNGYVPDAVVCLKFPAYYLKHPRKIVWLLHQHREVYDLRDSGNEQGTRRDRREEDALRALITEKDTRFLKACGRLFTNSQNVSDRLFRYNGIRAAPLYHPPPLAGMLRCAEALPYVFFPSRLEALKRQDLLIESMRHVTTPVMALMAGTGGQQSAWRAMIDRLGLGGRVRLLGRVSAEELAEYYARCLAVFFGPRDEDYGYVTLEAMLAAKPVVTCTDSGGPLEFVAHGETGLVVEPEPAAVAEAIDRLWRDRRRACEMGLAGRRRYEDMGISWENVVERLLGRDEPEDP